MNMKIKKNLMGDPFNLPLEVVKSLSSDEYRTVIHTLYRKYGSWIEEQFESLHAHSLVLCDRKVVYASKNRYEPKDEVVEKIETRTKKPCYIFMKELFIEELSSWSDLGKCSANYDNNPHAGVPACIFVARTPRRSKNNKTNFTEQ
ncbi:TPA: hypothetical protein EYP66_14170 [Candidatus Poribacteria bacterium]|nr:hypothetical protein [Candidatus Poribacteria bacterium]